MLNLFQNNFFYNFENLNKDCLSLSKDRSGYSEFICIDLIYNVLYRDVLMNSFGKMFSESKKIPNSKFKYNFKYNSLLVIKKFKDISDM